jgi:LytS/YehU family sensor histidine kinase
VRNSIHAKQENDPENERSGIGFNNVIERLKLIYPRKFQASVNQDEKEFFVQLAIQS